MTYKPWFPTPQPKLPAAEPLRRSEPPAAAEQPWPLPDDERDMFEVMYRRAVAAALKPKPPPVEEDPHDWVWE